MDASTKDTLVKAIQLLKTGDKKSAVPLLANILKKEPGLVQAWYLLGLAVDSEAQKIRSFKQALKLDPGHEKARQALAKLESPPRAPEIIPEPEPQVKLEPEPQFGFEPEPEPEPETFLPIREEPPVVDEYATGPLEESLLDYQNGFDEEETQVSTPVTPYEEELVMDRLGSLGDQPEYEPGEPQIEEAEQEPPLQKPGVPGDEFALPEWMSESTFDPSDYQPEQPAEQPAGEIYENTEEDIPEWAKMNPYAEDGTPAEPEPLPDMPAWASMIPPKDQRPDPEDSIEEEVELPSWATEDETLDEDDAPDQVVSEASDIDRVAAFFEQEDTKEDTDSEEDAPEEPEWLSGMVTEGEDGKKKKKKRKKKDSTPTEKKKRRQTIIRILLLVIIVGGAAGGYFFREELQPYWAKVKPYTDIVVNPVKTIAAPATDLLTQGAPLTYLLTPNYNVTPTVTSTPPAQPTAAPTWTPEGAIVPPTPTLRLTLNPDETPTITPTSSPLPDEIEARIEEIETQIEIMRGLAGPVTLNREFVNLTKLRQDMELQLIDADRLDNFEDDLLLLNALGFIRGNVDLAEPLLNTYADAAGGYYSPESKKIELIGSHFDGFGEIEQYLYALEYAHTLQDSNFNLTNLGYFPQCTLTAQKCQAVNALVKGDAALVLQLWLEQNPPENITEINNYEYPPTLFGPAQPAPFFTRDAEFSPTYGLAFVEYLYDNGGWNSVNRAFSILPSTTEQILHPEKYQQREEAGSIVYPSYTDLLGQEWELLREDSLGEWYTYLLLGYNDYPTGQRPETEAAVAAEGWSVDRYQLYYTPESSQTFLSVYWIWDSEEDSNQFYTSLNASLDARFGGASEELSDGGRCWTFGGQKSCIQQQGPKVYWLLSENADMVDVVRGRFNVFP